MHISFADLGAAHSTHGSGWRRHGRTNDASSTEAASATAQRVSEQKSAQTSSETVNSLQQASDSIARLKDQLGALGTSFPLPEQDSSTAVSAARLINKERGVMQVTTLEGDVVTLRFNARTAVTYSAAQRDDGTTTATSSKLDVASRSRLSMQVDGNLNSDELAAINDLMSKVGDLTDAFFAGNVDEALSKATSLSMDSTQLSGYSLDLTLKQSFYGYAAATATSSVTPAAATDTSDSSSTPVTLKPTNTDEVATASTAVPSADAAVVESATTEAAADSATPATSTPTSVPTATPATPASDSSGTSSLWQYAARVKASFTANVGDDSLGFSYAFKAKLLVSVIQQSASGSVSDEAAKTLSTALGAAQA